MVYRILAMDNITYMLALLLFPVPNEPNFGPKASFWSQSFTSLSTSLHKTRNIPGFRLKDHSDLEYRMPADQAVANSTYARSPDRLSPPHTGTTSTSTGESRTGVVPTTGRTLLEHSLRYHPLTHPLTLNLTLDCMQNIIFCSVKFQAFLYRMVICKVR